MLFLCRCIERTLMPRLLLLEVACRAQQPIQSCFDVHAQQLTVLCLLQEESSSSRLADGPQDCCLRLVRL